MRSTRVSLRYSIHLRAPTLPNDLLGTFKIGKLSCPPYRLFYDEYATFSDNTALHEMLLGFAEVFKKKSSFF